MIPPAKIGHPLVDHTGYHSGAWQRRLEKENQ